MSEKEHQQHKNFSVELLFCTENGVQKEFSKNVITVGASNNCDICFSAEDEISNYHSTIRINGDEWLLTPLEGKESWVNGKVIDKVTVLHGGDLVSFGRVNGPGFRVTKMVGETMTARLREMRTFSASMVANATMAASEKPYQRKVVDRWFNRLNNNYKKRMLQIAATGIILLAFASAVLYYQQVHLNRLNALASGLFYQMKEMELQIFNTEEIYAVAGDSSSAQISQQHWEKYQEMEKQYDQYLEELGFLEGMTEKERIILRVARVFGECELNVPKDFIVRINDYIKRWSSTPRYRKAIEGAIEQGYVKYISQKLIENHLPPHFFYLAMQESDFDTHNCGPRTRYGIAKGMWQFIPTTAVHFGLKLGPLVEVRKPDPRDERHHFKKSTNAAVKYLRFLYRTEAQASGLLVMASYNWGEGKIIRILNKLPQNPRERNFWNVVNKFDFPKETQDYVYYIFSAAVIGENPELFGFDLEKPLAGILN
ncbi:MAG: FHA domain-containing protein [Calditrichaeota bacterium]|nr:MAG: FHA domain-containing protein [Calditrichota bacterium]